MHTNSKSDSYAAAGVDITAGYTAVELMKRHIARTVTDGVCDKIGGFGGQGVLSLGLIMAAMGKYRNLNVSWLPSYGPEMRGGTANCAVIVNKGPIGSPIVDSNCDLLVVLNRPSLDKYLPELAPDYARSRRIEIYDANEKVFR